MVIMVSVNKKDKQESTNEAIYSLLKASLFNSQIRCPYTVERWSIYKEIRWLVSIISRCCLFYRMVRLIIDWMLFTDKYLMMPDGVRNFSQCFRKRVRRTWQR